MTWQNFANASLTQLIIVRRREAFKVGKSRKKSTVYTTTRTCIYVLWTSVSRRQLLLMLPVTYVRCCKTGAHGTFTFARWLCEKVSRYCRDDAVAMMSSRWCRRDDAVAMMLSLTMSRLRERDESARALREFSSTCNTATQLEHFYCLLLIRVPQTNSTSVSSTSNKADNFSIWLDKNLSVLRLQN
jgi:hypothetical protein